MRTAATKNERTNPQEQTQDFGTERKYPLEAIQRRSGAQRRIKVLQGMNLVPCPNNDVGIAQDAWFFDEGYIPWVVEKVVTEMDLKPSDTFVDIGGGTGNYTLMIAKKAGLKGAELVVRCPNSLHRY